MKCTQGQRQGAREREGVPSNPSRRRLRKGLWSPDEDDKLINYITRNGLGGCWNYVAKQADLQRCGKSCRLRWINYLRPGLKRGAFSRQEERLIINLQSNLGNRWSQIAAHLPGRTDNEVKNYWNSSIKKRLMAKHDRSSSSTAPVNGDTNRKSNFTPQSNPSCNTNSMRPAADNVLDVVTSSHTAEPYLEVMPAEEGHKPAHNSAFNILLTARENQLCAPGILELKPEQAQDQNDEFLMYPDPTNINQLICYSKLLFNDNSSHANDSFSNHTSLISPSLQAQGLHKAAKPSACRGSTLESVPPHKLHGSSNNYSLGSTGISVPALVESQSFIGKIENDGQINENQIMIDYSSFTASTGISAWSFGGHSSSNIAADFTDVYSGVSYSNELLEIAILEDLVTVDHEKTANQSCPPLNSVAAPPISWANNLDAADDRKDRLNLRYDEVLKYTEINSSRQKSYQIEGGGRIADQLADCSRIFNQEAKAKPIPAVLGGAGSAPLEIHECKGGAGQVAVCAQDDMYNIHTAAASDFFDQIYFS